MTAYITGCVLYTNPENMPQIKSLFPPPFDPHQNGGGIVDLGYYGEVNISEFVELIGSLAPFIHDRGYVEMENGECTWRYVFVSREYHEVAPVLTWPDFPDTA